MALAEAFRLGRRLARATLVSYAQVLFSSRPVAGLLFLAASFAFDPLVGAAGLVAALSANLTALRLWHDRVRWELGLAGYNGVLLGLALGLLLPHSRLVFLLAAFGGLVSAVATEWLNHRFRRWNLPVLGLPFLIFAWLVFAAVSGNAILRPPLPDLPVPGIIAETLKAFGSAFFSPGALSGLLVLSGLCVASRIGAAAGLSGALLAAAVGLFRPPSVALSLNLIVASVGLSFFLVPRLRAVWQVLVGMILTLGLVLVMEPAAKTLRMPILILPLTCTLFLFLLLGRWPSSGVKLVPVRLLSSPEKHRRIYRHYVPAVLRLPFFGTWFVSQGIRGKETHKGRLAFAWDFQVQDERGRTFKTPGYRLSDYYAFGLPVCAPAPGRVAAVENDVQDNAPGKLNKERNWGNYVVIEHNAVEYSILAHLQQGSVKVKLGDRVSAGTVVGLCGNSGYSGQPHLHYQLQDGPAPGSDALAAEFHDYLVLSYGQERLVPRGRPLQGEVVRPLSSSQPRATV